MNRTFSRAGRYRSHSSDCPVIQINADCVAPCSHVPGAADRLADTEGETTMFRPLVDRRTLLGGLAALAATRRAHAAKAPALPSAPVAINVIDVAGQLQLTQGAMEAFAKANPKLVSKIGFSQAPAPELPGKLKAQQAAGRVDIDLVLTGTDGLSAGIDQKLWVPLVTDYGAELPKLQDIYLPGAWKMQGLAQDQAVCVVFCPAGPIIEYMPDAVKVAPKTAQELLDWSKAHPEAVPLRAAGQFRPRPHLPAGPALHPRRQGPDGPEGRLGQDLGVPGRTGQEHRVLPDRHRRDDEGTGRGLARHHRLASRLGPQSAHPGRGAEGGGGRHARRLPLGHRRAVLGDPEGRVRRQAGRAAGDDPVHAHQAGAGDDLRQGLFLSRSGGEGRAAVDGAAGEPGAR